MAAEGALDSGTAERLGQFRDGERDRIDIFAAPNRRAATTPAP